MCLRIRAVQPSALVYGWQRLVSVKVASPVLTDWKKQLATPLVLSATTRPRPPLMDSEITPAHATLPVETIRNDRLPPLPPVPGDTPIELRQQHKKRRQLLRDFCTIYSALLDDVKVLDTNLESQYTREILRLVINIAESFGIKMNGNGCHNMDAGGSKDPEEKSLDDKIQRFVDAIEAVRPTSTGPAVGMEPVQGLSGATVVDYLVALITTKSPSSKSEFRTSLDSLGRRHSPSPQPPLHPH